LTPTLNADKQVTQRLVAQGSKMGIRVLVADDAELIRRGIKLLLKDRDDISVIGEASNFPETIQKAAELLPDVLIIDLRMTANANGELASLTNGPMVVAQAKRLGATKFIDKMD